MFRDELAGLVVLGYPLVTSGEQIDCDCFEEMLGSSFDAKIAVSGISTRLTVSPQSPKYQHNLSDQVVVALWVENSYWQHFGGRKSGKLEMLIKPSSITWWRRRLGDAGEEAILKATIEAGVAMKVITSHYVNRVNIETTVQTEAIHYPTDARLYDGARECLGVHVLNA